MSKPKKNQLSNYAKYSSMAFQMGIIVFGGSYGGVLLDRYLNWNFPVFTITFSILSVVIAVYFFIKDLIKSDKKS
jgi:predicted MFS family arabinose efflux permease